MQNLTKRFIAILLIISLFPKLGMEMYLHHLLHQQQNTHTANESNTNQLSQKCNCLDDAFMPLAQSPSVDIIAPAKEFILLYSKVNSVFLSLPKDYLLLRGPPYSA